MMHDKPKRTTVSLEDLLRVKRAERPAPEFWDQFDRDLRIKQLAAIVEPRPWWAPLIRVGARFSRYQVPVGAAAILALSFATIRDYRTTDYQPILVSSPVVASVAPAAAPMTAELAPVQELPVANDAPVAVETTVVAAATGQVSHTVPLVDEARVTPELTPSARYIAANLAAAQADDPTLVEDVFGRAMRSAEGRQSLRDPLTQISTNRESRRSRLLSTALPVAAGAYEAGVPGTDRVSRHLTEERLYDTFSRVGLSGDRVAIKF